MANASTLDRQANVTASTLATQWGVSADVATKTFKVTTQRGIRDMEAPIFKRYQTRQSHLQQNYLQSNFYSDTFESNTKSIHGNQYAQIFVNDRHYTKIYPMKLRSDAGLQLNKFIEDVGIPAKLITDNAGEETGGDWAAVCKKHLIVQRFTEPYSPWQNRAERKIQEVKKHFRRIMHRYHVPEKLWSYGIVYTALIRNHLANANIKDRTPIETQREIHQIYRNYYTSISINRLNSSSLPNCFCNPRRNLVNGWDQHPTLVRQCVIMY